MVRTNALVLFGGMLALSPFPSGTVLSAQTVTIAPQVIVVDAATRSTSVTLVNTGTTVSEITFSTEYGYAVTDADGFMRLQSPKVVADTAPSVARWIQIFPQRLRLVPNERRVIRILVSPPTHLPDGEYWARLIVSARGGNIPVAGIQDSSRLKIGLALEVRSSLPFFFRKGKTNTGIQLGKTRTTIVGDSLVTRTSLSRTGNSAFIGSLRVTLRDAAGKVAAQNFLPLGVFYTLDPRLPVSIRGLKKGSYQLSVEVVSSRPDVPQRVLLAAAPAQRSIRVTIP